MDSTIKAAILGAVATILAAIIGVFAGKTIEQKNIEKQFNLAIGDGVNIVGNGNKITINDIENFMNNYLNLQEQKESLLAQNTKYFDDLDKANKKIKELQMQTENIPILNYNNLSLTIDAEDIPINPDNSMLTIDGREYLSKEIAEKLLSDNQNMTIKDDTLFIGKVVADKANLTEKWIIDSDCCKVVDSIKDSYGNIHTNALSFYASSGTIIYNLNAEYSNFKFTMATSELRAIEGNVNVTIKADDEIIFSEDIDKKTEQVSRDIPLNNCNILTIQCKDSRKNTYYYCNSIISNAILYN